MPVVLRIVLPILATSLMLGGVGIPSAYAEDVVLLRGSAKAEFMASIGWGGKARCLGVGVARSNNRWAMAWSTDKCGPHSGHTRVFRKSPQGKWVYLFYDMEDDGCKRFNMPQSVRRDFAPYVC